MAAPRFKNRTAEEIANSERRFTTAWTARQALSWLDLGERTDSVSALLYAALELRNAIELLWYEHIVVATGEKMTRRDYERYKGSSTKIAKHMKREGRVYEKLAEFSNIVLKTTCTNIQVVRWDIDRLLKAHGQLAKYLHFHGMPEETWASSEWRTRCKSEVRDIGLYLWESLKRGSTGLMKEEQMEPEVRQMWEQFREGRLSADDCEGRLRIAGPVFRKRRMLRGEM